MMDPWFFGGWGFLMMIGWLAFPALIVVGIVLVVRSSATGGAGAVPSSRGRALEILDERFARGEIDQKEYEERRRLLTGHTS